MAYRQMNIPTEPDEQPLEWKLERINGGTNIHDQEIKILDNQSPNMLNMWFVDRILTKRYGQEYLFDDLTDPVLQSIYYKGHIILHIGTKLYKYSLSTRTEIYSGLTASKGSFFIFNEILYYLNGAEFIQWNNTTAQAVVGKIPIVVINRTPTGGGDFNEAYNRIQPGFTTWFNGDNTAVNYTLPQSGLDSTTVTCTVGGATKVEGVDFTVNRTTGIVTFSVAPATGQNNVIITAYKTDTAAANSIKHCKYIVSFGGDNDTRMFAAGNGTNEYYWSGLLDATYWPDTNYNLSISGEAVTGFGKQYDVLAIFTQRSVDRVEYLLDIDGPYFPAKQINPSIGCDMPWTIQLIDNRLTWCNTYGGVYTLVSTNIRDERNIKPVSRNINGTISRAGILQEPNLVNATSFDALGMYWLCIGSKVWVWDYLETPYINTGDVEADQIRLAWFPLNNINANTFVDVDGQIYYGDRTAGKFAHFIQNKNDFGQPIEGYWRSKVLRFNLTNFLKTVYKLWFSTTASAGSVISINYFNENGDSLGSATVPPGKTASFDWSTFDWAAWTWGAVRYANTIRLKPKIKKIINFQVEFRNNVLNENLSLMDLVIQYIVEKEVK
jgi:hypothetical protein